MIFRKAAANSTNCGSLCLCGQRNLSKIEPLHLDTEVTHAHGIYFLYQQVGTVLVQNFLL